MLPEPVYNLAFRAYYVAVWEPAEAQVIAVDRDTRCEPRYRTTGRRHWTITLDRVSCKEAKAIEASKPDHEWFKTRVIPFARVELRIADVRSQHNFDYDEIDWPVKIGDFVPVSVDPANRNSFIPQSTTAYVKRIQNLSKMLAWMFLCCSVVGSFGIYGLFRARESRVRQDERYRQIVADEINDHYR